jgi:hypothetical protein
MTVTESDIRAHAESFGQALVAGDIDQAIADFSPELRRNLGEVLAIFPLPATEATVESVQQAGSGFNVVLLLVGETDEVQVQTRWKDRDGEPKLVEASHLSRRAIEAEIAEAEAAVAEGEPTESG